MKASRLFCLFFASVIILQPLSALAFETDQYNLPPEPLADIGSEVSEYVEDNLRRAIADLNTQISRHEACLEGTITKGCGTDLAERQKLASLRTRDALAAAVFAPLGDGNLFVTKFGRWMTSHKFHSEPASYKTGYTRSIFVVLPADYLTLSPTVKLYGKEFGIDKLEHMFQQGYEYYKIEEEARHEGLSRQQAVGFAVRWGQKTERTYFGLLTSGVYSNADLYANYAGMKFYQGLTQKVPVGDSVRQPIVAMTNGWWILNERSLGDNLLKPFIADHLNEALNPSSYSLLLYGSVRRIVKKYACTDWRSRYPDLTADELKSRSASLEDWNGEDYGFTKRDRVVTIADACF